MSGWLHEEALEWSGRIDADVATKERDIEGVKQERQRDLIKLKVSGQPGTLPDFLLKSCQTGPVGQYYGAQI